LGPVPDARVTFGLVGPDVGGSDFDGDSIGSGDAGETIFFGFGMVLLIT
jgi:hypothetical protein